MAEAETVNQKACSACEERKPLGAFPSDLRRKDGCGAKCRQCARAVAASYYSKYPGKEAERRMRNAEHGARWYRQNRESQIHRMKWHRILTLYGVSQETYDSMLKAQGGKCAICGSQDPGRGDGHFAIDHDHRTGAVRGLLCQKCNCGIGFFDDDLERMERAITYVRSSSI